MFFRSDQAERPIKRLLAISFACLVYFSAHLAAPQPSNTLRLQPKKTLLRAGMTLANDSKS
jgi:hypothetical protein